MTATVETVAEQLDLAPVVTAERILPAVARQVTISDADVGKFLLIYTHNFESIFIEYLAYHY